MEFRNFKLKKKPAEYRLVYDTQKVSDSVMEGFNLHFMSYDTIFLLYSNMSLLDLATLCYICLGRNPVRKCLDIIVFKKCESP